MDSSASPKEEIWFLRVCHYISNAVYHCGGEIVVLVSIVVLKAYNSLASTTSRETFALNCIHFVLGLTKKLVAVTLSELNPGK